MVRPKRPIEELAEPAKAQAEADVVLDAADRAIIEFFSDPKNRIPPRERGDDRTGPPFSTAVVH
jgi:hypothetical protein